MPGNHDLTNPHSFRYDGDTAIREPSATEDDFEAIYAGCGYKDAVERGPRKLDYMNYPTEDIAFIGVDSNEENTPDEAKVQGGLTREQVKWIASMMEKAHSDNRRVILCMHHNPVEFYNNGSLLRGDNIANAKYDYTNSELISDLCTAGIDVVFSGHSHMHSITSAESGSRGICSVVTSSLVNLPLAYRTGTVTKDGLMTISSGDVQDCRPSSGVDLRKEGERYWHGLAGFYMYDISRKCWDNTVVAILLSQMLGFETREDLEEFFKERAMDTFYTFTYYTSNGNEHLFTPEVHVKEAEDAVDGIVEFIISKLASKYMENDEELTVEDARAQAVELLDGILTMMLGTDTDGLKSTAGELFDSAYNNFYGADRTPVPDDSVTIQLTGVENPAAQ